MTTLGMECSYQWTLTTSTCNAYCCNRNGSGEGDWCRACTRDGTCFTDHCAPAQTQMEYVLEQLFNEKVTQLIAIGGLIGVIIAWLSLLLNPGARHACNSTRAYGHRWMLSGILTLIFTVIVMYLLVGAYLFSDCHHRFRGISDLLLVFCGVSLILCTFALAFAVARHASVPKLDELLHLLTEAYQRGDEHVLILHVGEDCLRSFYQQQLEEDEAVSIEVDQTAGLRFNKFINILSTVLFPVVVYFLFSQRATAFVCISELLVVIAMCSRYVMKRPRVYQWLKQRWIQARMSKLSQQETVVLFHNTRSSGLEDLRPDDPSFMSAAFFGNQHVCLPYVSAGEESLNTYRVMARTRIVEETNSWQIRISLLAEFNRPNNPLSSTNVKIRHAMHFPLEPRDVPKAEVWLENHEIFHFENE